MGSRPRTGDAAHEDAMREFPARASRRGPPSLKVRPGLLLEIHGELEPLLSYAAPFYCPTPSHNPQEMRETARLWPFTSKRMSPKKSRFSGRSPSRVTIPTAARVVGTLVAGSPQSCRRAPDELRIPAHLHFGIQVAIEVVLAVHREFRRARPSTP